MTGPFSTLLVGCILSMTLGISPAKARSGRIVFSGAVVAPTCASSNASSISPAPQASGERPISGQFVCLDADGTANTARSYSRTETHLDAASISGYRLLSHLAGSESSEASGVTLVTHTFR